MLLVSILFFGLLGSFDGFPLESPSDNFEDYFAPFIIGGVDAPDGFAIHMAALIFGERVKSMWCGASIVTRSQFLTAAHCIEPLILNSGKLSPSFRGSVGSNKWNSGGLTVHFENYHIHPGWNSNTIKNDIAVLELTEELVFNKKVGPIALGFGWVGGGEGTFTTGWGRTGPRFEDDVVHLAPTPDDLQLLHKHTIDSGRCVIEMDASQSAVPVDPAIEICTFHSKGRGMCNGDSGSALVLETTNEQIGIVSWGFPCAVGAPDIFVRISHYFDYLSKILKHSKD